MFSIGFKISYFFPLIVILTFRMAEELILHLRILKRDKIINNLDVLVKIRGKNNYINKKSKNL